MTALIPVLRVAHVFVTLAMIGVVLIQRSEGGGLGIGTTQGMGAFMTGRGTANLLTRTTAILASAFFAISLTLAIGLAPEGARDAAAASVASPVSLPLPPISRSVSTVSSAVRLIHTSCLNRLATSKMIDRWTMKG